MDVELIKALATLSGAGVDVKTLIGQNQAEDKDEKKDENTISFEEVLKMLQAKPEPKPESKPASNNVSFDDVLKLIKAAKEPEKKEEPEDKEAAPASGLNDEQFNKLLQAMNVKNVAIDIPEDNEWKKNLANHFSELINGKDEKEDK